MTLTTANSLTQLMTDVNAKANSAYAAANSYVNSTFVIDDPSTVANVKSLIVANTIMDANNEVLVKRRTKTSKTFYIAKTGNDTNSGQLASPFLTVGRAIDEINKYEWVNCAPTIKVFDGVYTFNSGNWNEIDLPKVDMVGGSPFRACYFVGNNQFANAVQFNFTALSRGSGQFGIRNHGQNSWYISGFRLFANSGSLIGSSESTYVSNVHFAGCQHRNFVAYGGYNNIFGNIMVSNGCLDHIYTWSQGEVFNWSTTTFVGTPNFSNFVNAQDGSQISLNGASYVGSATGRRFRIGRNSQVTTGTDILNWLPGNTIGLFEGGSYDSFVNGVKRITAAEGNNETIFVSYTNGSDVTGWGTESNPYKTISKALRDVPHYIGMDREQQLTSGNNINIRTQLNVKLLDGTHFVQGRLFYRVPDGINLAVSGNTQSINAVTISAYSKGNGRSSGFRWITNGGGMALWRQFKCECPIGGRMFGINEDSILNLENINYGYFSNAYHISFYGAGTLWESGNNYISGNAAGHITTYSNGFMEGWSNVIIVGTPTVSTFLNNQGGLIYYYPTVYNANSAWGRKLSSYVGGITESWDYSMTNYPGNQMPRLYDNATFDETSHRGGIFGFDNANNVTSFTMDITENMAWQRYYIYNLWRESTGTDTFWTLRLRAANTATLITSNSYHFWMTGGWPDVGSGTSIGHWGWGKYNMGYVPLDWGVNPSQQLARQGITTTIQIDVLSPQYSKLYWDFQNTPGGVSSHPNLDIGGRGQIFYFQTWRSWNNNQYIEYFNGGFGLSIETNSGSNINMPSQRVYDQMRLQASDGDQFHLHYHRYNDLATDQR